MQTKNLFRSAFSLVVIISFSSLVGCSKWFSSHESEPENVIEIKSDPNSSSIIERQGEALLTSEELWAEPIDDAEEYVAIVANLELSSEPLDRIKVRKVRQFVQRQTFTGEATLDAFLIANNTLNDIAVLYQQTLVDANTATHGQ